MGLNCSHGAFDGAYSRFYRFRIAVVEATGGTWPSISEPEGSWWYFGEGYTDETHPGLYAFLCHSDCEGSIKPKLCRKIADEMEALLPKIDARPDNRPGDRATDYGEMARTFIAGCRLAANEGKKLRFG